MFLALAPVVLVAVAVAEVSDSSGIGDTLAKAIKSVTGGKVKPCKGCEKRREALNRMVPYNRKCKTCGEANKTDD